MSIHCPLPMTFNFIAYTYDNLLKFNDPKSIINKSWNLLNTTIVLMWS